MKYFVQGERIKNYEDKSNLISSIVSSEVNQSINIQLHVPLEDIMASINKLLLKSNAYEILDTIGRKKNGLGYIVRAKIYSIPDRIFSCRIIEFPKISTYLKDSIIREYYSYKSKQTKYMVNIEFICIENFRVLFFYKYYEFTLHTCINQKKPISKYSMLRTIISAFNELHSQFPPIVHGHITPHNILIDENWEPLISDYGFENLKKFSSALIKYRNKNGWTAPEQLSTNTLITHSPSCANDVYSLGMLIWFMIYERDPFDVPYDQVPKFVVEQNMRPLILKDCNSKIALMMRICWQKAESQRPTMLSLLNEMRNINEKDLV